MTLGRGCRTAFGCRHDKSPRFSSASSTTGDAVRGSDPPSLAVMSVGDRVEQAIERHADTPGEIERGGREKPRNLRRNIFWLAVTAVSLYLVFPKLVDVFGSWRQITRFSAASLVTMAALQVAVNACQWDLQRVALRARRWRPVIAAQLASNALSNIAPGGGPVGAALQYRMLVRAGLDGPASVSALTAVNLLVFGVVRARPVSPSPGAPSRDCCVGTSIARCCRLPSRASRFSPSPALSSPSCWQPIARWP